MQQQMRRGVLTVLQIKWLWSNMDEKSRRWHTFALLISIVTSAMLPINPYLTSKLVDEVIVAQNAAPLVPLLMWMLVIQVLRMGSRYGMVVILESTSQKTLLSLRKQLFSALQFEDIRFFDKHRTGDLMTRLTGDLDWCRHFVAYICFQITDSVVMLIATLATFFFVNWKLTLALFAVTPLLMIFTKTYSTKVRPLFMDMREKLSEMNTTAQENIAGNRVVKAFAREPYEEMRFQQKNDAFKDANLLINKLWLSFYPFIELMANAMTFITMFLGGLFIIWGELTPGELAIFTGLAWALANPMRNLGSLLNEVQRFLTSSSKVMELYYSKPFIRDSADALDHEKMTGRIEFRDVTFGYDGQASVLRHVDFSVEPGQTLAIMGPTGSGKTTLINLLARFYDVTSGQVLVDGDNVKQWHLQQLRRGIGTATQDVFLFSDTVEGNIAFGDQSLTEAEARDFARRADAAGFIESMPEGYDTIVGERGVGLSGGQRQRLALARALAMKPAILVMDDTTSAVDMETEKYIQEQLRTLPYPCTKIIIAQRISSLKDADQILVLKDGGIEERGTHEELLQNKGYYWETYALQNGLSDMGKGA